MSVATLSAGSRPVAIRSSSTTVLVMALLAATGWTVLSGGWVEASSSAVLVGVVGAVEAVVLARGRVSRSSALLSTPLLLFASLLPTTLATRPVAPPGINHLVGQYVGAAATGLLGNASWEFNVSLSALLWACGAWTAWFAVRERRGALATAPGWAVLAVTVINAPAPANVGLAATVTAVAAIMLIAAVHLERLNDSWIQRRVGVLPGTDGRFATAAAAGGLLIVLLALVAPPLTSTDLSGRLFGFGGSNGGSGIGTTPGGLGVGPAGTVRFNPSTIPDGSLTLANTPVLTYRSSTSAGMYLQMATDGVFDGGNWLPDESALNNGDFAEEVVDPGAIPRDRSVDDGGVGAQQQAVTATVTLTNDTSGTNVLPFPGEPDATSLGARASGLVQPGPGGQLLTVDGVTAVRQVAGSTFVASATQSTATAAQLRAAGTVYPSFITRDGFLPLPDDGSGGAAVIRTLANQWAASAGNAYDAATIIESKLRDPKLFHYTLKPPQPPAGSGEWPVTYFLTTSHSGYCQYFATAMGAMLRALGIPSRLINGYGPGTSPSSAAHGINEETVFTVTSDDAHTWVEGYFPGYGWIPFEPTPPSVAGDYKTFGRGGSPTAPTGPTGGASAAPTPTPSSRTNPAVTGATPGGGGGVPTVVLTRGAVGVGVVLLPLAVFAAWFLRPRTLRGIWRRIGIVGALAGVPRDPALTFDEYAARLTAAVPRAAESSRGAPAALADIAAISDRALYARNGLDATDQTRIEVAWRQVARLLPSLGWRVLRQRRAAP
jgi:transglutaminase-like putative cysteine protease